MDSPVTETGNHGHGHTPIGDWLSDHWDSAEHAVASGIGRLTPHHDESQAPADQPGNLQTPTEGEPVSVIGEIEQAAKDLAAKFDGVDHAALDALEAVQNHPAAYGAFRTLASLAGLNVPASALTTAVDVLEMTAAKYAPATTGPAQAPAAPAQASTDPRQFGDHSAP